MGTMWYRNDSVLRIFLEGLSELSVRGRKTKLKPTPSIRFVRPGQVLNSKSVKSSFGILNKANDWVLLSDIGQSKLFFPPMIFVTSERPDILLFSIKMRTVVLIENTSGCEENQSENHHLKTEKYSDLVEGIRANNWVCHFFAVEVGARGFNSSHVPFCLKSLGFKPKEVKQMLGKLCRASLEASYHIWLNRDDKMWKAPVIEWQSPFPSPSNVSSCVESPVQPKSSSAPVASSPVVSKGDAVMESEIDFTIGPPSPPAESLTLKSDLLSSNAVPLSAPTTKSSAVVSRRSSFLSPFRRPLIGLVNLGSTCYANSVLNCLFPFRELWDFPSSSKLHQSFKTMMMCLNSKSGKPLAPKSFLKALSEHITSLRPDRFRFNVQHDAAEVLGYVLDDIKSVNKKPELMASSAFVRSYRCQICLSSIVSVDAEESVINLNVSESITCSISTLLSGCEVERYCETCMANTTTIEQPSFSFHPGVLIFRLQRAVFGVGQAQRLANSIFCDRKLSLEAGYGDEVSLSDYSLVSVVHHVGESTSSGHYTTTLLNCKTKKLWKYDDRKISETALDQNTAYLLLYRKCS